MVVTVVLMILLSLIAVGLLSLASTTLRSTYKQQSHLEARNNARLALQIAIGKLQKSMGSDKAISAPATTIHQNAAQPHLVGAWQSWHWDPSTQSESPSYQTEKEKRFLGWLASRRQGDSTLPDLDFPTNRPTTDIVELLGEGTFGTALNEDPIVSELVEVGDGNGKYAWTVLAEDTKARINLIRDEARPTNGQYLASNLTFPERMGREALEIESFSPGSESEWSRLISNKSLDVASGDGSTTSEAKSLFFDYTTHSRGVLCDVANGGLKQDLTIILENGLKDGERLYSGTTTPFGVSDPHWSYLSDYYQQHLKFNSNSATEAIDVTSNIVQSNFNKNDSSPTSVTLKPVVAKLQILFSLVTHPLSTKGNATITRAYNTEDSAFAGQHLRAWLSFEPIVTLWNPYSVPIEFDGLSIRLDKIPVAFRFAKDAGGRTGEADLRVEDPQTGDRINRSYWPLSNFVWGGGKEDAISNFSFDITGGDMSSGISREAVRLEPGENKIFTAFIQEGDSWEDVKDDFCIQGSGAVGSSNARSVIKNVPFVEGWNTMGGFRVDHIARWQASRNIFSLYDFERRATTSPQNTLIDQNWFMWCALRPQDSIVVKAKLANNDVNSDREDEATDDFTMLVEMDRKGGIKSDRILGNSFTVQQKENLYEEDVAIPIVRSFPAITILQEESDTTRGGKTPFAVFTMTAKTSNELLSPTKGWLFSNPVLTGYSQDEDEAPQPVQSYEFSFREVNSTNSFPMVEIDPVSNRSYFGSGQSAESGLTASPMFVLPTNPMVSVGQFQAANLISGVRPPFFNYPLGNSHAHPLLPPEKAVKGTFVDHSYLLNQRLWDSYYFSGMSKGSSGSNKEALDGFFQDKTTLTPRLKPYLVNGENQESIISTLSTGNDLASREMAAYQMLEGPFNIHSTSIPAWKALLMSAYEVAVPTRDGDELAVTEGSAFSRFLPTYSEKLNDLTKAAGSGDVGEDALRRAERWLGFHQLTNEQAEQLATEIVTQIKLRCAEDRGPFLSLSEFVNRKLGSSDENFTNKGVLQTAIDLTNDPQGNASNAGIGVEGQLFSLEDGVGITEVDPLLANPSALEGNTAEGSPATLLQGDLLQHLGATLTVRSDTYRIRAYGASTSASGAIEAQAWCEAIVQRVPEFVDGSQSPGTPFDQLNQTNINFGRRFKIVSFRWLSPLEV